MAIWFSHPTYSRYATEYSPGPPESCQNFKIPAFRLQSFLPLLPPQRETAEDLESQQIGAPPPLVTPLPLPRTPRRVVWLFWEGQSLRSPPATLNPSHLGHRPPPWLTARHPNPSASLPPAIATPQAEAGCWAFGKASLAFCFSVGSFTLVASPSFWKKEMTPQVTSYCHHSRPCRALNSKAWWLLCHPSPNARIPTHLQGTEFWLFDNTRMPTHLQSIDLGLVENTRKPSHLHDAGCPDGE
jgi:hypothetical protein